MKMNTNKKFKTPGKQCAMTLMMCVMTGTWPRCFSILTQVMMQLNARIFFHIIIQKAGSSYEMYAWSAGGNPSAAISSPACVRARNRHK